MQAITRLFPLWAILVSALAIAAPGVFRPLGPAVTGLLALIMFAMGVTLRPTDFRRILTRPAPVLAGLGLHYLVMPLAAWGLARVFAMPPDLAAGMILVGSVASGTASTVMVFLARGDVALSVTISAFSTLAGIVATPLLTRLYVSAQIAVNEWGLLLSILQVVAAPVALGLIVNAAAPRLVRRVEPVLPLTSMAAILAIIGAVVSGVHGSLLAVGPGVLLAVALHNGVGLLCGYWGGRLLGFDERICRTLALEVGMQNSGLAATLGRLYFTPLAALPGAVFSVWHNLSGSLLAGFWGGRPAGEASAYEPAPHSPASSSSNARR
jgi:bile acid:Na+ symporter, BASS family